MEPRPAPQNPQKTGGERDAEPAAEQPVKSGGMAAEGGSPVSGEAEDDRQGGMIGEG